jgi:beta-phosphoglucomutase family hydrolase
MTDNAVIFDMDGTLVDNMPLHIECWIALFQDEGRAVTAQDYHASGIGGSAEEVARHFLGEHLTDAQTERLVDEKEFLYPTLARRRLKLLRGTRRMLWQARREEIPLALATSAGEQNVEFFMETQNLHGYFDVVLDAGSVTRTKPHPDVFLKAADRMGVPPDRCLVFEDSLPGLEAARRAGMRAVGMATMHPPEQLRRLAHVVGVIQDYAGVSLRELLAELG